MTIFYVCTQGHEWPSGKPPLPGQIVICPLCGSLGALRAASAVTEKVDPLGETLPPSDARPLLSSFPSLDIEIASQRPDPENLPESIGNYRIVEQLGRGGMGVVYKARQPGLDRFVAIKMIIAGKYSGEQLVSRFRQEAEAISRLQHPNFVQIHEIGEHEGRPFLVLEYIDGSSLARLRGHPLPSNAAVRLVEQLSRAMAHAHRRGIVHRDITPANVLLAWGDDPQRKHATAQTLATQVNAAVPKITDFGLAKRLDVDLGQTQAGMIMGTPSYMAPEQASGRIELAGPSCDIYALGAVLYELLTGRPPFLGETPLATLEQVINKDPVPLRQLQPGVPRDVETICLKCLEKEPAKRYASADELADDLARFLEGVPIRARRTSVVVKASKWIRRKPAAAGLLFVSALAVVSLLVGSQWYNAQVRKERNTAEENLRIALLAVDGMLSEVGEQQLAFEPRMEQKRRALLGKALQLYQQFLEQRRNDRRLKLETAHAFRRMGDIERWLGNYVEAQPAYEQAIRMFDQLRQEKDLPEYRRWVAHCLDFLGESHRLVSETEQAQLCYHKAIQLQQELIRQNPSQLDFQQEFARTNYNLGILYRETNQMEQSETVLRQALDVLGTLVKNNNSRSDFRQELARVHTNLGPVLRATNRGSEAVEQYSKAIALLNDLSAAHPERPDYRHELAVAHTNRGNALQASNRTSDAQKEYQFARQTLEPLVYDYPDVPVFLQELANTENSLGAAFVDDEQFAAAEEAWLNATVRLRKLTSSPTSLPAYRADLGLTLGNLGWLYVRNAEYAKAAQQLHEGIECLEQSLSTNPAHADYLLSLRRQYLDLAEASLHLSDYSTAASAITRMMETSGTTPHDTFNAACLFVRAGIVVLEDKKLVEHERHQRATDYWQQATSLFDSLSQNPILDLKTIQQVRPLLLPAFEHDAQLEKSFAALLAGAKERIDSDEE